MGCSHAWDCHGLHLLNEGRWIHTERRRQPPQGGQLHSPTVVAPADGVDRHPAHRRQIPDRLHSGIEHGQRQLAFADSHFLLALLSILWYVVSITTVIYNTLLLLYCQHAICYLYICTK